MSDETQLNAAEPEILVPDVPVAEGEAKSEPAPDSQSEDESNQKNGVQKRMNELTAKRYEAEAIAKAEKERAEELERQLEQAKAQPLAASPEPTQTQAIQPPSPDLFYEDEALYNQKYAEYTAQITQQAIQTQTESQREAERQRLAQERVQQAQANTQKRIIDNAAELGIDVETVHQSAQALANRGCTADMIDALTQHEKSAALIDYLAKNPATFEEVKAESSMLGIIRKLDSLQEDALKRNISSAPEPVETLTGKSAKEPGVFEQKYPGAQIL